MTALEAKRIANEVNKITDDEMKMISNQDEIKSEKIIKSIQTIQNRIYKATTEGEYYTTWTNWDIKSDMINIIFDHFKELGFKIFKQDEEYLDTYKISWKI